MQNDLRQRYGQVPVDVGRRGRQPGQVIMYQAQRVTGAEGGSPVPSSYRTAPSAYTSARWSTARPVRPVCSGARYASVPGISLWCVNSGRISAIDVARAKSTRVGVPSAATTTLAGVRSRWITSRRCTSAKARAIPRANRARSRAGSGFGRSARVRSPASVRTIEPSCGGSSASCATPTAPRKRSSTANSCRSRRPASGPSGSFTISARSGRDSRVTRVRALSCTTANRTGGSTPSAIPHLHAWSQTRSPGPPPSLRLPTDEGDRRRATLSLPESRPWRSPAITPANRLLQPRADLNMRVESQGAERRADSVQAFMSAHLQSAHAFDVLLDDDRAGEAADLVGITVVGAELHVTLVHCKYSARETAGARLGDLHELCGQAVRGAKWRRAGRPAAALPPRPAGTALSGAFRTVAVRGGRHQPALPHPRAGSDSPASVPHDPRAAGPVGNRGDRRAPAAIRRCRGLC